MRQGGSQVRVSTPRGSDVAPAPLRGGVTNSNCEKALLMDRAHFELLKAKYGHWTSWAIWAEEGDSPKSNVGDLSVFEGTGFLDELKPNIVFVGLNISRGLLRAPLANFHDLRPEATDYRIRYALRGSPWWGGYMTDVIKDLNEPSSAKVVKYLRDNKPFEQANLETFREELDDLGSTDPTIIAFGKVAYSILARNLGDKHRIVPITHYAHYISKERYREELSRNWQ